MKTEELIIGYTSMLHLRNYSSETVQSYVHHLILFLNFFKTSVLTKLSSNDLFDYFSYLQNSKNVSFSSMKQSIAAIHFLYEDVFRKKMDFGFLSKLKIHNDLKCILSTTEIKKIIDSIINLKHKAILSTIYSCGLRVSEVTNIKIIDLDLVTMKIKVVCSSVSNERYVMLSKKLLQILLIYIKKYHPSKFLFEGREGGKYSSRSIEEIFRNAVQSSGINKKVSVHSLRHSFAFHLAEKGTDIHIIQQLLGHKNLSSTRVYSNILPVSISKIKSPFDDL